MIVIGPRQVGKTTLVRQITENLSARTLWLTGDDPETRALLDNISLARLQILIGQNEVVVVDEAQRFTNAGLMLKLITDHLPQVQLFVTGSSSLDLAAQTKESLTGRKIEFNLYPLSFVEMCGHHGYLAERSLLEQRMLYGCFLCALPPAFAQSKCAQRNKKRAKNLFLRQRYPQRDPEKLRSAFTKPYGSDKNICQSSILYS